MYDYRAPGGDFHRTLGARARLLPTAGCRQAEARRLTTLNPLRLAYMCAA